MTKLKKYEVIGIMVVSFVAALLGYIFLHNPGNYGFLNFLVTKDTSLWELSKVIFLALIIYAVFEYFIIGHEYDNFLFGKGVSIVLAPILFLFLTYLLDLIVGNVYIWLHFFTFFLSIIFAHVISSYFINEEFYFKLMNVFGVIAIFALITIFASYTATPELLPFFVPMDKYQTYILR
jgi:hypothetical protein